MHAIETVVAEQTASGLERGEAAPAVPEERARAIEERSHRVGEGGDERVESRDGRLVDAAGPAGGLDRDQLDVRGQKIRPGTIGRGAASGEGEAEESQSRRRVGTGNDEPGIAGTLRGRDLHDRSVRRGDGRMRQ